MFLEESIWIRKRLLEMDFSRIKSAVDIGSSSLEFRQVVQPYIDKNIFSILRERDVKVTHLDKKLEDGVDVICDFNDADQLAQIDEKFDLVFCTNVLEHVESLDSFIQAIVKFINSGGYLLVTVPRRYMLHNDPIDTGFRPTNKALEGIFSGLTPIRSEIVRINDKSYYEDTFSGLIRFYIPPIRWSVSCLLAQGKL